ncbi:hypothetical protein [Nonomuraea endophytica]|uniref:Uncharacterized protein n=1 Tax=Nonomuraea endophytica TaxID=714136 RepID=A0A7W8AHJ5_9ACTN|nr:hypothetical protein [Nonomuraea endophytica]MBB5085250.1 hypothetical protein [Nonomuraea endophytica]
MDTGQTLAMIAASTRAAYGPGQHLRVRSSGIVHDVTLTKWLAGELLPGPACMVGVAGWDPSAAHPDSGPVTCKRCLRLSDDAAPGVTQLELFPVAPTPAPDSGSAGNGPAARPT